MELTQYDGITIESKTDCKGTEYFMVHDLMSGLKSRPVKLFPRVEDVERFYKKIMERKRAWEK
jgi:hypothetical protein